MTNKGHNDTFSLEKELRKDCRELMWVYGNDMQM